MENNGIMAVAVLYGRRLRQTEAYRTLLRDMPDVYIQDNSAEAENPEGLPEGWIYKSTPSNPGLSAAYNAAAAIARRKGLKWLLIADQDTTFPEGMYERLKTKLGNEGGREKMYVARMRLSDGRYLSPVKRRGYIAAVSSTPMEGIIDLRTTAVINSGMLVDVDAFLESGGYNEKVFLDFSDFQFVDRFSQHTTRAEVLDEECIQSFSAVDDRGEKKIGRYVRFCESLSGYETHGLGARLSLAVVVIKRGIRISLALRSLKPLKIMIDKYFLRRSGAKKPIRETDSK